MKTNNSTKWKYLLFFGLGSLVVGLSLLAFGAAAGGIDGIKDNTKATKEVQTFDKVKNLQIESPYGVFVESGDVDKITVTYYSHDKFLPNTKITQTGDTLKLEQADRGSFVTGFMEVGGYELNEHDQASEHGYTQTVITVPKGVIFDTITGTPSSLNNITAKTLNISNTHELYKVTAEEGIVSLGAAYISDSQLKNMTFDYVDSIQFVNTSLEASQFNNFTGYLSADDSLLKNISFSSPEQELPADDDVYWENYTPDDEYSYSAKGSLSLDNSTLENITYKGDAEITGQSLTLLGVNDFSGSVLSADLKLTKDNRKAISLDLATNHGTITLDQKAPEDAGITIKDDANSFTQKIDKAKADLIIKSKQGNIFLQ